MRKIFTFLFMTFCALLMNAQTFDGTYNFGAATVGTYTQEFTPLEGLTAYAASDKSIEIDDESKDYEVDGTTVYTFTHRLKLGGSGKWNDGTPYGRILAFTVSGNATITVYARASSSSATTDGSENDRPLNIDAGSTENNLYSKAVSNVDGISANTCNYTGNDATTIYVYSAHSGINLFGIDVEYKTTGIKDIPFGAEVVSTEYYNLSGVMVGSETSTLKNGVYIKKVTYDTGDIATSKISILR